jgi:hypothetical protein
MRWSPVLTAMAVTAVFGLTVAGRAANSDNYRYKWPWPDTASSGIAALPYQGVHGCYPDGEPPYECAAAYDLTISNNSVVSSAEVTVDVADNLVTVCTSSGYGTYVEAGGVRYAHLAALAPGVAGGVDLLQGDAIGTQGNTGNTLPPHCGVHLHWQFLSGVVPTIDGGSASSSNSFIGEDSPLGETLRNYYINHGSWNTIGWTHAICPGVCTLDMTANKSWGRMQDFQHDPDPLGARFDTVLATREGGRNGPNGTTTHRRRGA